MKLYLAIRRLLAILAIAGLVLAPASRPVMAGTSSDVSMQDKMQAVADDMSASDTTDEIASDMPCCPPSKAPLPVGCDKCAFMAACTSMCFTGVSMDIVHPLLTTTGRIASLRNDAWPDGLGHPPPEHPPRILV